MNKSELIEHIAKQADISKAAATRALEALDRRREDHAEEERQCHDRRLRHLRGQQARRAHRPQPAHRRGDQDQGRQGAEVPPGKALKDALN